MGGGKKKKKKPERSGKKSSTFTVDVSLMREFAKVGLDPPLTPDEVANILQTVEAKLKEHIESTASRSEQRDKKKVELTKKLEEWQKKLEELRLK
eukprot:Trichotokara_eunicae@DN5440_c0_g1_i1.p1